MNVNHIKNTQLLALEKECLKNNIDFKTIERLLKGEKVKNMQKRNHYIQQTINSEIEKVVGYEN